MKTVPLSQLADIQYGYPFDSKSFKGKGKIRIIRIRDIKKPDEATFYDGEYDEEYVIRNGDIIVGMDGEFNCAIWNNGPALLNQRVARITPKPSVSKGYLYNFLKVKLKEEEQKVTCSTVKHLLNTNFRNLQIPFMPLESQMKVASMLEKADIIIQKRKQANKMSNNLLIAIFLKMFGDKHAENTIGDITKFVSSGSTPLGGQKTYLSEGIMFIRSQNVYMNEFKLDDVAYISEETHQKMKRTWLRNDDVLLNITGASLGRVAVYKGEDNKANVNQHVCIIRVDKSKALPEYVSHYLSMPNAQREIWANQAGASRQALNFQQVRKLTLLLPTIEEQKRFVKILSRVNSVKENQKESTREIDSLFNSLMAKAFSVSLN